MRILKNPFGCSASHLRLNFLGSLQSTVARSVMTEYLEKTEKTPHLLLCNDHSWRVVKNIAVQIYLLDLWFLNIYLQDFADRILCGYGWCFQINVYSVFLIDFILMKGYHWSELKFSSNHSLLIFTKKM